jgi:hypothetical protein
MKWLEGRIKVKFTMLAMNMIGSEVNERQKMGIVKTMKL